MMKREQVEDKLVLGVDGGQTNTLTILATTQGKILASAITGPVNHIHEPGGKERQYKALQQGYRSVFSATGLKPMKVHSAFLGLSGHGSLDIAKKAIPADNLEIADDAVIALSGAVPSMIGVTIISGTGSVAYGRNSDGDTVHVGGWGYFAGDEGSGYDIARQAFRAIYQTFDGRGPKTLLSQLILEFYDCLDLHQLHRKVYSSELTRNQIAQSAAVVGKAASHGDSIAIDILSNAGVELGTAVATALTRLSMVNIPVPVSPVGGVFNSGALVIEPMMNRIIQTSNKAYLQMPRFIPAIGAILLALQKMDIPLNETILSNLQKSYVQINEIN
jgi:N-acetylglucosamine kinase-like BadF-type ATPase